MAQSTRKRSILKRIARIILKTVLFLILFVVLIALLILTPPVQSFLRKKAVTYLEHKLHTKVAVGRIFIGLPKKIIVEDVYIEDLQKDTLLSAGSLKINIGILKLIFKGDLDIKNVELANTTIKIRRELPDTVFNFQFILDALNPPSEKKTPDTTSPSSSPIAIHKVSLDKIRFVYKDAISGNNVETWLEHFDTKIDKLDPGLMQFDIPQTTIAGLNAKIYQVKPLVSPAPLSKDIQEASEPINLSLDLKNINLENIQFDYRNDVSALYTNISLGKTEIKVKRIDLAHQLIDIDDISMDNTNARLRLGKKEEAKTVITQTKQEVVSRTEAGWRVQASSIALNNNNLRFENDNEPQQKTGMDYAHLKVDTLTLHVKNFLLSDDSIGGQITKAHFKEKSGFELQELETKFLYANNQSYLQDLYIKTPGTEIKRDVAIRYASIDALSADPGNMQLDADIKNSRILVNDVLVFVPSLRETPAFADPSATWYINSRIKGRVADMQIETLQVNGLEDTRIDISGHIAGLPDMKNAAADLSIRNISSSKRDIEKFIPAGTLPSNITLPNRLNISGTVKGNTTNMNTNVSVKTDLGNAFVKGRFDHFTDPQRTGYDATVQAESLDLGTILQQKENFGTVTASFTAKGNGIDPKTAEAVFTGKINSAVINQYNYRDLDLNGSIAGHQLKAYAGIIDPNIHFAIHAEADLSKDYPSVFVDGMIDSIKLQPLHLTSDIIIYRGKIEADFPVTDPDNLQGKLFITQSLLVRNNQRLQLDTVQLLAGNNDSGHYVLLNSDLVYAELTGQYKLTQLGNIFQQAIEPYFALQTSPAPQQSYDFKLNAYVINSPALRSIVPGLENLDSVQLQSHFSDKEGWNASLIAPVLDMQGNRLRGLRMEAATADGKINVKTTLRQFKNGSIDIYNTTLTASLANNNIDFALNIQDKSSKEKYNLEGSFQKLQTGSYVLSLKNKKLLLNYIAWNISEGNKLTFTGNSINASDLVLSHGNQELKINSPSQDINSPMDVNFTNFKLITLTGLVQTDTTLADGTINGKLTLIDLTSTPVFTGDLTITDLRIQNDTVGNVHLIVNNKVSNTYHAEMTIEGRGNNVKLAGNYTPETPDNNFDFVLDIGEMPLTTVQAFSGGLIKNSSGSVNGKFTVKGTMSKPLVNGDLNFNKTAFNLSMFNNFFYVDQKKIEINNDGFRFNDFALKDSAGNSLIISGTAATSNFQNYKFDLNLRANNFRALNSTKKDNKLFYGKLYFTTNMTVKGTEELPIIDGRLTINEKTKMTVVLPQSEPGMVDREGVIEFVDMDAPLNDSLFRAAIDSSVTVFRGMDVSLIIDVNKEADFTLIVDEGNGDFLNVKGEALLTASMDRSGKMIMSGTYELESGSYQLSFNMLKRKFDIEKGSKIIWEGEPTDAIVDVTAKYVANVAPLDLVKGELGDDVSDQQRNMYLQKLPFDVLLKMTGKLMEPKITFDIILPENKTYAISNDVVTNVRTKLDQLRPQEAEMNKQVFSLLLLNRFVAENPFTSSSGGSPTSTLIRQSVSKLMTEQLNQLATDLIQGVDVNFDVQSSEDYSSGERQDRTELNVGLSKRLLNDRLTVTVGSNFELEGPQNSAKASSNIAGNVGIDYKLSKDGRYKLRAYRKNEYEGAIDGYVVETGVGFIITIDYNRFREIFMGEKKKQEMREKRRKEREQKEQQQATTEPAKKQG